ncbi:MAG: sulfatase, partial [Thermoanaerobaculia bacterium]|nr:sulfatase [Thermoanaerobaculia bacterium]
VVEPFEWKFDRDGHSWQPVGLLHGPAIEPMPVEGALRLPLDERYPHPRYPHLARGYLFVELPDLALREWSRIEVTARASAGMKNMGLLFNYDPQSPDRVPFYSFGDRVPLVSDGTLQTYSLSLDPGRVRRPWSGPWTDLGIWFSGEPGAGDTVTDEAWLDLFAVRIVPAAADFAGEPAGVRMVRRGDARQPGPPTLRRAIFQHAPGSLTYRLEIPPAGRLDFGLGVLTATDPVTFLVEIVSGGVEHLLFEEAWSDPDSWAQRSVDLGRFEGETVDLTLRAQAETAGSVAFWATPIVSGTRATDLPNIVLYVIDGGGADYMSLYDYPRPTTPNLERLAAHGAVFDRAHSNSAWTRPSTASFLTSLQHSVLGGLRNGRNPVPPGASTLAERLHAAGYQTALFTTNSNAGRISDLDRGNDWFREAGVENFSTSSDDLHDDFWAWRSAYPGEPFAVHFQTTDVHNPHAPEAPFAGLYIDSARRQQADEWTAATEEIPETETTGIREALELVGADSSAYWTSQRDLHDECLAHQDHEIGRLVERLRATGQWENTLFVVAADHSVAAGSWDYSLLMREPSPEHVYHDDRATPILRSGVSRIPLVVVWPGRIAPGQRFSEPVSMIDLLPTLLDLAGLPAPEILQGRSLAPLLLTEPDWEERPVILDDFEVVAETGELRGRIEVIDGRWGASLEVNPDPDLPAERQRTAPLLLFDLWNDPECLTSLHEERPELAERYRRFLQEQLAAHLTLATRFDERAADSPLTSEQLETLRSLGYIQ